MLKKVIYKYTSRGIVKPLLLMTMEVKVEGDMTNGVPGPLDYSPQLGQGRFELVPPVLLKNSNKIELAPF